MRLNITKEQLHKEYVICDTDTHLLFFIEDFSKMYEKYTNVFIYENITNANLSDYKYIVLMQK